MILLLNNQRLSMRLTADAREIIRQATREIFGESARVRLFGSRIDDERRGGDIDLLIELPEPQADVRKKSLSLAARLQARLGDQPIDILVIDPHTVLQPIHHEASATGVPV